MDWAYTSLLSAALGLSIMASSDHSSRSRRAKASTSVSSSYLMLIECLAWRLKDEHASLASSSKDPGGLLANVAAWCQKGKCLKKYLTSFGESHLATYTKHV